MLYRGNLDCFSNSVTSLTCWEEPGEGEDDPPEAAGHTKVVCQDEHSGAQQAGQRKQILLVQKEMAKKLCGCRLCLELHLFQILPTLFSDRVMEYTTNVEKKINWLTVNNPY